AIARRCVVNGCGRRKRRASHRATLKRGLLRPTQRDTKAAEQAAKGGHLDSAAHHLTYMNRKAGWGHATLSLSSERRLPERAPFEARPHTCRISHAHIEAHPLR